MSVSVEMKEHLASNVTFLCQLWKMTAKDGGVVAYAAHTRKLTYGGTLYKPAPVDPSRPVRTIGLEADTAELAGVFDADLTKSDLEGGRWKGAVIVKEIVNYTDLTMGSVLRQKGKAGTFQISGEQYTLEFRSLADQMNQTIGDLTSSVDRRRRLDELGISITSFTHAGVVTSVTSRRKFKIGYVQPSADYFRYGLVAWNGGANDGLEMEIKSSTTTDAGTKTEIELQKPMRSVVVVGDPGNFYRGYDGTRAAATALGAEVMESMEGEPDVPPLSFVLTYPQS
jgi:uncharacterized phage protein (TIGR02218 family)